MNLVKQVVKQSGNHTTAPVHNTSIKHASGKQHKGKKKDEPASFAFVLMNAAVSPAVFQHNTPKPATHTPVDTSSKSRVKGFEVPLRADIRALRDNLHGAQTSGPHSTALSKDNPHKPETSGEMSLLTSDPKNQSSHERSTFVLAKRLVSTTPQGTLGSVQSDSTNSKPRVGHSGISAVHNATLGKPLGTSPGTSLGTPQIIQTTDSSVSTGTVHVRKHGDEHRKADNQSQTALSTFAIHHAGSAGTPQAHTSSSQVLNLRSPTVANQFSQVVAQQLSQHQSKVTVQVEPEGLGPIVVHVHETGGQLNIHVEATQMQTMQWFHAERPSLLGHLADSGHAVQAMEISFSNSFSNPGQGGTQQSPFSWPQDSGARSGLTHSQSGIHGSATVGPDERRWYV